MSVELSPAVASAWNEARVELGLTSYQLKGGEMNDVLLANGDEAVVVKVPRYSRYADTVQMLRREVAVVNAIHEKGSTFGVQIPTVRYAQTDGTVPWAAFGFAKGTTLDFKMVAAFSTSEKVAYGQRIGAFVAAMEASMDVITFNRRIDLPHGMSPIDRTRFLSNQQPDRLRAAGYPELARAVSDLQRQYNKLYAEGRLERRIVGHDDLHPLNCAFVQNADGLWLLNSIFDFAIAKKHTSPEREMRFVSSLGDEAVQAAAGAYEATGRKRVDPNLIHFWRRVHWATSTALVLTTGGTPKATTVRELQAAFPDSDWASEFYLQKS